MREPGRCFNQFKEVKDAQIYNEYKNVEMNVQMAQKWLFYSRGRGILHQAEFICMSIDINYFALLSFIYNLQL